jgi:hypothetical protein
MYDATVKAYYDNYRSLNPEIIKNNLRVCQQRYRASPTHKIKISLNKGEYYMKKCIANNDPVKEFRLFICCYNALNGTGNKRRIKQESL